MGDTRLLVGGSTYAHMATVYRATSTDQSALDWYQRVTGGVRVSAHVPAASSNDQQLIVRRGSMMDAVCPIWSSASVIVDRVTKAAEGEVVLTVNALAGAKVLRTAGFAQKAVQLA